MFDDDLEHPKQLTTLKNLEPMSLDELSLYIEELKEEIIRTEQEILRKKNSNKAFMNFSLKDGCRKLSSEFLTDGLSLRSFVSKRVFLAYATAACVLCRLANYSLKWPWWANGECRLRGLDSRKVDVNLSMTELHMSTIDAFSGVFSEKTNQRSILKKNQGNSVRGTTRGIPKLKGFKELQ